MIAYEVLLQYGTGTPDTTLANVFSLAFPEIVADEVETTVFDGSGSGTFFKTYEAGLKDAGEISAEVRFTEDGYAAATALIGTEQAFQIDFVGTGAVTNANIAFNGFIKSVGGDLAIGEEVNNTVVIRVTGEPTFTASTDS